MSSTTFLRFAVWAALAGALIPVMAALNGRLGRALGEPLHAVWCLFAIGLLAASAASLVVTGRLPAASALRGAPPMMLTGGFIVGFYVLGLAIAQLAPSGTSIRGT